MSKSFKTTNKPNAQKIFSISEETILTANKSEGMYNKCLQI